ncbi:DUF1810 domain-containing protein (plasmid) [Azospirillum brasilense]|uniref:DUF1810 domain-containing protein n=1 Tax=Azospirillum brasilense TaxID=192 RepID=A0A4D8QU29_AZOBR|nr:MULTISPECIES: DUF1810 domain-containing protein [Azospirillum]MDW7554474.1 DUF1810 domain-containing protein [Azospirillum brasilense]MDW7556347.1 DUF1810 domain-containing protein [Azospirillum brasilense]MDW7594007.1 DUF1810 domain-containing protein [Azospirillum brasilense]MDW7632109.1 DUF1810 domain-containing protein [Azospirillum brasilense]MDX5950023.1 DUF1810 domain-containing protein [Azospirillum brasilense]
MQMNDSFDLQRFVTAQEPVFATVLDELQGGRKRSHWMWFIFPQLRGLGRSANAEFYGIVSLDEARAYLAHPTLGRRLETATRAVLAVQGRTLHAIFGSPDDMKFHSSMTLFALAADGTAPLYRKTLERCFHGRMDRATLAALGSPGADGPTA